MAMVIVDDSSLQADSQPKSGAVLHSPDEPSELSQWPCGHDDSTILFSLSVLMAIFQVNVG